MSTTTIERVEVRPTQVGEIPLSRLVRVELRKMFNTRSGFWLVASIAITGLIATGAVIMFAPDKDLTYYTFTKAIGFPITVILPIIALLAITSEWSQRTGLTTFTLVPHRSRVIGAKTISSVAIAVASMFFAFVVGAVGNVVGSAIAGTSLTWDMSFTHGLTIVLGNLLCLLTGTMFGMLIRNSPGALVAYFVYALLLTNVTEALAASQAGFRHVRPWIDLNVDQGGLFEGTINGIQWAQLAVATGIWLVVPGYVGVRRVLRAEVK